MSRRRRSANASLPGRNPGFLPDDPPDDARGSPPRAPLAAARRRRRVPWGWLVVGGIIAGLVAPWLAPQDPTVINLAQALQPPAPVHWLGTDQLGRDVLSRMLYGARISLLVSVVAVGISTVLGLVIGATAGYLGGAVDLLLMRGADIMLCFPTFFLILAVVAFLNPGLVNIMAVIGLTSWMGIARPVRAEVLSIKEREFVLAARVMGASTVWILRKHLLPNVMAPIIVNATLGMGAAILLESGLSFLGLGVQPPTPSWGNILTEGKETLGVAWWLTLFPGVAILLTVLACHMVGEWLRLKEAAPDLSSRSRRRRAWRT